MLRISVLLSLILQSIASANLEEPYMEHIKSLLTTFPKNPPGSVRQSTNDAEIPVTERIPLVPEISRKSEEATEPDIQPVINSRKGKHMRQTYNKLPVYLEKMFFDRKKKNQHYQDGEPSFHFLPHMYPTELPVDTLNEEAFSTNIVPFNYNFVTKPTIIPTYEATPSPYASTKSLYESTKTEKPIKNDPELRDFTEVTENPLNNPNYMHEEVVKKPTDYPLLSNDSHILVFDAQKNHRTRKDELIRSKLISLILSTKKDFEKLMRDVEDIHKTYKSGTMYKIGYLTGLIKKMNIKLSKLFPEVVSKYHKWDNLRILDTYERVKSSSDIAQGMLKMMKHFLQIEQMYNPKHKSENEDMQNMERAMTPGSAISWAYYDESLS